MNNGLNLEECVAAIKSVLPQDNKFSALHEPVFKGNEWKYVKDCLDTGWVSSVGEYVNRLEDGLVEYTGAKHAVAVVNGTAALYISLLLAGVDAGDEVIVPTLTFIATANAVSYCGAIPHFADCALDTLGIDPEKLSAYLSEIAEVTPLGCINRLTGRKISAVVPMHTFGHPVDLYPLLEICAKYKLVVVEDAAESLGTLYKGRHTGTFGLISSLSFNGNKTITTGGGGAILTNNAELAKLAKHITTQAKVPHRWEFNHDMLGYNHRMPNLNAALGCAQLEQLSTFVAKKRKLAELYQAAFAGINGLSVFKEPEFACSNYWLNALILDNDTAIERDKLLELTNSSGIMTRPAWTLMHKLPMYAECPKMDLNIAENLSERIINIPSSAFLGDGHA